MNWHEVDDQGQILCSGFCPDNADMSAFRGKNILLTDDASISFGTHRYSSSQKKFVRLPEKPNAYCCFDYKSNEWVFDYKMAWFPVTAKRNQLLQESDWTELPSARERLGEEMYQKWMDYRQALRDVTKQPDPLNIVWAVKPGQEK